ncbi:MAG: hypothetical protein FWE05_05390 [Defluviitaleaceae bacterium]|nr:hypothetical protein [Defluviitaleaceae bacterium]
MNCAYEQCIYNKAYKCILGTINIDDLGQCEDCIVVKIDSDTPALEKERQFNETETRRIVKIDTLYR